MQNNNDDVKKFSIFQNHYRNTATVSFDKIANAIINGRFKEQVEKVRQLRTDGKLDEANKEKQKLDAFTSSGVFVGRRNAENLKLYSQLIILDFDKLDNDKLTECITKARSIEYTYCSFISPSGNGLKVLCMVDSGKEHHKIAYSQVANYYEEEFKIEIDRSGSDITRLCYLPYDPQFFLDENSTVFHVEVDNNHSKDNVQSTTDSLATLKEYNLAVHHTKRVAKFEEGKRNNFVYTLARNCNKRRISLEDAQRLILKDYGYNISEAKNTVKSAYNHKVVEVSNTKSTVMSLNYLAFKKCKPTVKIDTWVLFEVFIVKYLYYRKPFYYSRAEIEKDLRIKKDRAKTILKYFKEIGFVDSNVIGTKINGKPRQVTYFKVFPENIPDVIDALMNNGEEIKQRLKKLLDSGESIEIDYGYQE